MQCYVALYFFLPSDYIKRNKQTKIILNNIAINVFLLFAKYYLLQNATKYHIIKKGKLREKGFYW